MLNIVSCSAAMGRPVSPPHMPGATSRPCLLSDSRSIVNASRTYAGDSAYAAAISAGYAQNFFGQERMASLLATAPESGGTVSRWKRLSRREFWQLCLRNVSELDDEGHGCTPARLPKSTWQLVYSAVNQMDDLASGLRQFANLVPSIRTGMEVSIGYGRQGVHVNFTACDGSADAERFERYLELVALALHCVLRRITARPIRPVQIRVSALINANDGSLLTGLAPSVVRKGHGVTIVYDRADMQLPLGVRKYQHWSSETTALEELDSDASLYVTEPGYGVADQIRHLMATRTLTMQQAARATGMSIATLQRRLRETGTSFREISKEIRCEKLVSLLATDIHLDDLAEQLGLSERRSLWRTCQEWLGVSPSEYRRRQLAIADRPSHQSRARLHAPGAPNLESS